MKRIFCCWLAILVIAGSLFTYAAEVVVYTALDQIYSEPLLKQFEETTGIRVLPVYDTESNKTVGLVNRLIAEKANPQCDVFWNNEIARTLVLKQKGILAPYISPAAEEIPATFKDPKHYWTGFAARARIIIVNTDLVSEDHMPQSIWDLADPRWYGQTAIANPLFGTTSTHAAALFAKLGPEKAKKYFLAIKKNKTIVAAGNATVRDMVARGEIPFGMTDTDDANGAIEDGRPVRIVVPGQEKEGMGVLVIPNTVSLIAGAPHEKEGQRLIDFLLSAETEKHLAGCRSVQIPLRPGVPVPYNVLKLDDLAVFDIRYEQIAEFLPESTKFIHEEFLP
ncbi:MAG: extracellular solute-binding protein [bacterium]